MNLSIFSESILPKNNPKIAIIGNGGVNIDDDKYIKEADVVVRFNNYATRDGINKTKDPLLCDILFTTFDLHSNGACPKNVVIGIPFPFHAKDIIIRSAKWYNSSKLWMVNPYVNMQMCADIGWGNNGYEHPFPSIGFTALWHMHNWNAEFYVTGFEFYYDDKTKTFQKWDIRNTKYPKTWNHNYPLEVKWILKNLYKKNNFIFSKRTKYILGVANDILKNEA